MIVADRHFSAIEQAKRPLPSRIAVRLLPPMVSFETIHVDSSYRLTRDAPLASHSLSVPHFAEDVLKLWSEYISLRALDHAEAADDSHPRPRRRAVAGNGSGKLGTVCRLGADDRIAPLPAASDPVHCCSTRIARCRMRREAHFLVDREQAVQTNVS